MLKEVGASGQISLGKKYAGQLYEVQTLASGEVRMLPVRVVSAMPVAAKAADTALQKTSTGAEDDDQWPQTHAQQIAAYNAWAEQRPPFSESVRQWRQSQILADAQKQRVA